MSGGFHPHRKRKTAKSPRNWGGSRGDANNGVPRVPSGKCRGVRPNCSNICTIWTCACPRGTPSGPMPTQAKAALRTIRAERPQSNMKRRSHLAMCPTPWGGVRPLQAPRTTARCNKRLRPQVGNQVQLHNGPLLPPTDANRPPATTNSGMGRRRSDYDGMGTVPDSATNAGAIPPRSTHRDDLHQRRERGRLSDEENPRQHGNRQGCDTF